ncbi:hypothetical protein DBR40_08595 [Pedobacter sp. KBW01]|uniref:hypothetical protein n=1 Tax=Pedobacter sp. KBW01 TaxID=2153364 RepID=UPI000F5ACFEA|nr:hypothetical protein [Pedobacter sp. KBW01]RQO78003.1 hypothetical protein DBR40_08595 [Pedobacter sp. KBW01]
MGKSNPIPYSPFIAGLRKTSIFPYDIIGDKQGFNKALFYIYSRTLKAKTTWLKTNWFGICLSYFDKQLK